MKVIVNPSPPQLVFDWSIANLIKAKRVVVKWTFPSESSGIFILHIPCSSSWSRWRRYGEDDHGLDDKDGDEGDGEKEECFVTILSWCNDEGDEGFFLDIMIMMKTMMIDDDHDYDDNDEDDDDNALWVFCMQACPDTCFQSPEEDPCFSACHTLNYRHIYHWYVQNHYHHQNRQHHHHNKRVHVLQHVLSGDINHIYLIHTRHSTMFLIAVCFFN